MNVLIAKVSGLVPAAARSRGFALPVVLLLLATMSVLAVKLVDRSRTEIYMARALVREAEARNAADAGYAMMVVRYAAAGARGEDAFIASLGRAQLDVRASPEAARIDLNTADPGLIAGILRVAGADAGLAQSLAGQVAAYRRSMAVLRDVDELLQFPGADSDLLGRIRPYVTVFRGAPGIDTGLAPRAVLLAIPEMTAAAADRIIAARAAGAPLQLEDDALISAYHDRGRTIVRISAAATLEDGSRFVRQAVVDFSNPTAPQVLDWRRLDAAAAPMARGLE